MKRALLTLSAASFALPAFADAGGIDSTVFLAAIFALACFVGYYVVWSVTPAEEQVNRKEQPKQWR